MKTSGKLLFSLMMLTILMTTVSGEETNSFATIYNVRNYGAKGDGKILDSLAINSAIQVANSNGGGI
jgi:polygalacturonase